MVRPPPLARTQWMQCIGRKHPRPTKSHPHHIQRTPASKDGEFGATKARGWLHRRRLGWASAFAPRWAGLRGWPYFLLLVLLSIDAGRPMHALSAWLLPCIVPFSFTHPLNHCRTAGGRWRRLVESGLLAAVAGRSSSCVACFRLPQHPYRHLIEAASDYLSRQRQQRAQQAAEEDTPFSLCLTHCAAGCCSAGGR